MAQSIQTLDKTSSTICLCVSDLGWIPMDLLRMAPAKSRQPFFSFFSLSLSLFLFLFRCSQIAWMFCSLLLRLTICIFFFSRTARSFSSIDFYCPPSSSVCLRSIIHLWLVFFLKKKRKEKKRKRNWCCPVSFFFLFFFPFFKIPLACRYEEKKWNVRHLSRSSSNRNRWPIDHSILPRICGLTGSFPFFFFLSTLVCVPCYYI